MDSKETNAASENQSQAATCGPSPGPGCSAKEMSNLLLHGCTVAPVPAGISFYRDGEIALRLDLHEERFLLEWLCIKHGIPMPNPTEQGTPARKAT